MLTSPSSAWACTSHSTSSKQRWRARATARTPLTRPSQCVSAEKCANHLESLRLFFQHMLGVPRSSEWRIERGIRMRDLRSREGTVRAGACVRAQRVPRASGWPERRAWPASHGAEACSASGNQLTHSHNRSWFATSQDTPSQDTLSQHTPSQRSSCARPRVSVRRAVCCPERCAVCITWHAPTCFLTRPTCF